MRPEILIPDLDNLIKLYESGVPIKKLAEKIGLRGPTLTRRFRAQGVKIRGRAEARRLKTDLPIELQENLVKRYKAGESVPDLSTSTGLSYEQIYNLFRRKNVPRRGISQARKIMWSRLPPDERARRGAEVSSRIRRTMTGRKHSPSWRARVARGRFRNQTHKGVGEDDVADRLRAAGLDVAQQFPIGPYNVDLAIGSLRIAVEIERPKSKSHPSIAQTRKRTEYLIDRGWTVLFALLTDASRNSFLNSTSVTEQVLAVAKILRRDKPSRGQYGMIGSKRQASPTFRSQLQDLPFIECP